MICPRCGSGMGWMGDFDFEDYEIDDEEGIVSCFHCANCGVDIEVYTPNKMEGDDEVRM